MIFMRCKVVVLLLIFLIFNAGCATVVFKNSKEDLGSESFDQFNSENCSITPIRLFFSGRFNRDFNPNFDNNVIDGSSNLYYLHDPAVKEILDLLKKIGVLSPVLSAAGDSRKPVYIVHFDTSFVQYKSSVQKYFFWLSNITLGLLPAWGEGEFAIQITVKNPENIKMKRYKFSIPLKTYQHISLLVLGSKYSVGTFETDNFPQIFHSLHEQLRRDQIICTH